MAISSQAQQHSSSQNFKNSAAVNCWFDNWLLTDFKCSFYLTKKCHKMICVCVCVCIKQMWISEWNNLNYHNEYCCWQTCSLLDWHIVFSLSFFPLRWKDVFAATFPTRLFLKLGSLSISVLFPLQMMGEGEGLKSGKCYLSGMGGLGCSLLSAIALLPGSYSNRVYCHHIVASVWVQRISDIKKNVSFFSGLQYKICCMKPRLESFDVSLCCPSGTFNTT